MQVTTCQPPHPQAAHIPIGAGQALCVQETFLPALDLERNRKDPIHTLLGSRGKDLQGRDPHRAHESPSGSCLSVLSFPLGSVPTLAIYNLWVPLVQG